MRTLLLGGLAFLALTSPSLGASMCQDGGIGALMSSGPHDAFVQIKAKCKPSETVVIPSTSWFVIGSICDFTKKNIMGRDGWVICVIAK